jgi:hypothetical protein
MDAAASRVPPRTITLLYLGTAHVALWLACALAAWWPQAVAGFFYHSWMVALVHLVTLGWITFSIFGAIYIVGPLALRLELRVRAADYVAYGAAVIGLAGMVAHFWIEEYDGMAWSAATITAAAMFVTARMAIEMRRARVHAAIKLHVVLACVNLWLAATMGVLIAIDKAAPFLPGFVLSNVFAHAHLATLGWPTMMVVGVGYRLLPMVLPSKMPSGRSLYASAILLEIGVLGLFALLLLRSRWAWVPALFVAGALAVFAGHVVWMLRHPAPRPAGAPRFDFAVAHAACAAGSLATALVLGVALVTVPTSSTMLRAAAGYGVLGLVGFLAQMVIAMEARILPMVSWSWAYAGTGYRVPPPSPHAMHDRSFQALVLAGWAVAVPALAAGMAFESATAVALGAWALCAAMTFATLNHMRVCGLRRLER